MKLFCFETGQWLPRPRNEIVEFFSDAFNLEKITPPWLRFRVLTPAPIAMREDTRIEYRLRIHGVPVRWQTRISAWHPPQGFVDEQISGPYRVWIHEHRFTERDGGTFCEDSVRYAPRGGAMMNRLFVARDVREIFTYRAERLNEFFPG
ncbi:MAG TPA: SRPBCC family protein [Candidatus Acidoferrales bacterium]|jgi:ligand-binding SRPBCC domain-containing protein|nr:SRPBCC family protein [Candidatus Acidoferrales bacterium]